MSKFSRSWQVFKSSAAILNANKSLLIFPLLATIGALAVLAGTGAAFVVLTKGDVSTGSESSALELTVTFVVYVALYTVAIFFNTALVATVAKRVDGENAGLGYGLGIALSKSGTILVYATIAATVGLLLRALEKRVGFIGQIVASLIGVAWAAATFLVVPILVHRNIGPLDAIGRSASMLKETWGENIIANSGMALFFTLIYLPFGTILVLSGISIVIGESVISGLSDGLATSPLVPATALLVLLLTGLIHSALQGIYSAALYRYASDDDSESSEEPGANFYNGDLLADAFSPK